MSEIKLKSGLCCESKSVNTGRWSETHPCDKKATTTVVAASGGSSLVPNGDQSALFHKRYDHKAFASGDTLHVCGTHKRKHEQRAKKAAQYQEDSDTSAQNRKDVEALLKKLGVRGSADWDWRSGRSSRVACIPLDELERILG